MFSIAETTRFLRYHYVNNVDNDNENDVDTDVLLDCEQPEYNEGYWALVEKYTQRGMLQDAWAVLSHHSACRRCTNTSNNSNSNNNLIEDEDSRIGFSHLYVWIIAMKMV